MWYDLSGLTYDVREFIAPKAISGPPGNPDQEAMVHVQGWAGMNWETGTDMYTLPCVK